MVTTTPSIFDVWQKWEDRRWTAANYQEPTPVFDRLVMDLCQATGNATGELNRLQVLGVLSPTDAHAFAMALTAPVVLDGQIVPTAAEAEHAATELGLVRGVLMLMGDETGDDV